jgi:hypothetical protein
MKSLLLLFTILFSMNTFASGCFPDDVYLAEETVVTTLPDSFSGQLNCYESGECSLYVYSDKPGEMREFYDLKLLNKKRIKAESMKNLIVKIYKQYFVSSCTEMFRIVIGVDTKDLRFRSEKDFDSL